MGESARIGIDSKRITTLRLVYRGKVTTVESVPSILASANLTRAYFPSRGIPYSILIHGMVFCVLFFLRVSHFRMEPPHPPQRAAVVHKNEPRVVMYLPILGSNSMGMIFPGKKVETPRKRATRASIPHTKGLSYPGPQPILSEPEKPTNEIQTLLQPGLENPPILAPPLSLPNFIQMAEAAPLPPLPKPVEPAVSQPEAAKPAEPPPVKPPEPAKTERMVLPVPPADVQSQVEWSEIVLPPLQAAPKIEMPSLVLPPLPPPKPEPKPPEPAPKKEPPAAAKTADAQEKPSPPKQSKSPDPAPAPAEKPKPEPPPKVAEKPKEPVAPKPSPSSGNGTDKQEILALTPLPAPIVQPLNVPQGEARGRFSISPEPNLSTSGTEPGSKQEAPPTPVEIASQPTLPNNNESAESAEPVMTPSVVEISIGTPQNKESSSNGNGGGSNTKHDARAGLGTKGTGSGKAGTAKGGASGPEKKPFSGITIAGGGSYDPGISENPVPVVQTPRPLQTAYGLTVISTENSGGGLPFSGVFAHEQIYTVYLDMRSAESDPAPSWTLEFAVIPGANQANASGNPVRSQEGLVLPFPAVKEALALPAELVRKHLRSMIIVYAVINAEGKMEQLSVKDSPEALLNEPLLDVLKKWVFRPARLNGEPVAVRALMGIPLWAPE